MNNYTWKLLEVTANGDLITHARYHVSATDGVNTVESEGNYYFKGTDIVIPYNEVREKIIIDWIINETTKDEVCSIKKRLDDQLEELKKELKIGMPWLANTFKPQI